MPSKLSALNAREQHWQRQAVQLARARVPFAVTNFNAARDGNFYFAIRSKYQLDAQIDYEAARADFHPLIGAAPTSPKPRLKFHIRRSSSPSGVQVDFSGLGESKGSTDA